MKFIGKTAPPVGDNCMYHLVYEDGCLGGSCFLKIGRVAAVSQFEKKWLLKTSLIYKMWCEGR